MATFEHNPDLRAFPVFDRLFDGLAAHPVTDDDNWPILTAGEFVVIDPAQRDPDVGELFVIQWDSGRRAIVEAILVGSARKLAVASLRREPALAMAGTDERQAPRYYDGPYPAEILKQKIVGRVVGILQPSFDETMLRRCN